MVCLCPLLHPPAKASLLGLLALLFVSTTPVPSAEAELSFWDRVRRPEQVSGELLLLEAERSRVAETALLVDGALDRLLARRTAILIELGGQGKVLPLALRFLYGEALVRADMGHAGEGLQLLQGALAEAPQSPLAARAWEGVAWAHAGKGDFVSEAMAYTQALALQWEPDARATLFLNRGEARMRLQTLPLAIADYERAIRLSHDAQTVALGHWGLGVAHDRDDNFPLARREIERALSLNMGTVAEPRWAIDSSDVWFAPEHEEYYYRALGLMVYALRPIPLADAVRALKRAMAHWDGYLLATLSSGAPWLPQARRNRDRCAGELQRLRAQSQ